MKKTAEDYLGHEVTKAVITVPAYLMIAKARLPKMLVLLQALKFCVLSMSRPQRPWLTE
jgi:molecular chaperone DnaK (HSP70)